MKRLRRFALLIIINAVLLVPLVYGFEFYLERRDPKRTAPANGIINGQRITWGYLVKNNRLGFRERDFETPKPQGVFRIMVIGDSLTWGPGLSPDQRYTKLLEERLNSAYPERKFEVLNFGAEAASTIQEREILRKNKDLVQPDLLIVGFCVNDPQPRVENYSIEREQFDARYARAFTSVKYRSRQLGLPALGQLIIDATYGFAEKRNVIPRTDKALERTYITASPEWQDFVKALGDIKQTSDEMKLPPPVFAVLNQSARIGSDYDHPSDFLARVTRLSRQAEEAAKELGFLTLNYEREIPVELANDSTSVNALDGHPSAKLNELYAKKLFATVSDDIGMNRTSPK
jgi:lysophospholipase L1-like esterase